MTEECQNCGAQIRTASAFKAANERYTEKPTAFANFINGTAHPEFCTKCGEAPFEEAKLKVST